MSTQSYCTSREKFNASYGNWEPAEYDEYLVCDCCGKNGADYDDNGRPTGASTSFEAYSIPWKNDYHVCEDCIKDFLSDEGNDCEGICPVCKELLNNEDQFAEHIFDHHITLEGV